MPRPLPPGLLTCPGKRERDVVEALAFGEIGRDTGLDRDILPLRKSAHPPPPVPRN